MEYWECVTRPFKDVKKLVFGSILLLIPFLSFAVFGYFMECARTARKKDLGMPAWSTFWLKLWEGILAAVIFAVYFAVFFALYLLLFYYDIDWFAFGGLIYLFLLALGLYIFPSSLVRFAVKKKFLSAFGAGAFRQAFRDKYFFAFLLGLANAFVLNLIFLVLLILVVAIAGVAWNIAYYCLLALYAVYLYSVTVAVFSLLGQSYKK
ncbi:DUF4013 domain-containing protein [Candidatus Woesearchaeota archaeon]|nr:DUF4013 domain-containing protein [Candidatus Woesearchaeota archaeon]